MKQANSFSYLNQLNEVQREAVESINGASMVIAGAGSGKTRVLTFKIAHMLNSGIKPHEIIALTFTNKAAREMKTRIASIIGEQSARYLWMGTFHSIFAKILRFEASVIGYPSSFSIYDTQDSKNLIKTIVKDLELDNKIYKEGEILSRISFAKNNLISAKAYAADSRIRKTDERSRRPDTYRIYQLYANKCKLAGAMDFDDILMNTNLLFSQSQEVLEKYQNKFKYILVDEYQDTNYSQYLIINQLAKRHNNICVVGDDAQSIYAFRGARIENILNFKNDYPNTKVFKLEQNYRSTQNIVNIANSLINKNKYQIKKNVFSENSEGNKISITEAFTDTEEAYIIANSINDTHFREHISFADFSILYRTNAQSRTLEDALRKKNIPYKIFGGISFYQRKEIKDLVSYFRLIINNGDDEAFKRIINYPKRGIGSTTITRLSEIADKSNVSLWQVAAQIDNLDIKINSATKNKIQNFLQLINGFKNAIINEDAYEIAKQIASKSGILTDLYNNKSPEGISKYENIQELLNGIKDFSIREREGEEPISLVQFVENVSLLTNEDNTSAEQPDCVNLMTVHSAKGLEFKHVFIAGMEEELFPSVYANDSAQAVEEERRLFYVAITRAEENLHISYARKRYRWGQLANCRKSRFLKDLNPKYVEFHEKGDFNDEFGSKYYGSEKHRANLKPSNKLNFSNFKQNSKPNGSKSFSQKFKLAKKLPQPSSVAKITNADKIKVGAVVNHKLFGRGIVAGVEGVTPNIKVKIDFENAGQKHLLLRFAKLEILQD